MERDIRPEIIIGAGLGLVAISLLSFPHRIKEQVRAEQEGRCADCGDKPKKLQTHHRLPTSLGGDNSRKNAVGLDDKCHKKWDRLALEEGIIWPGIELEQPVNVYKYHHKKGLKHYK